MDGLESQSSFRSDTAILSPINGLGKFIGRNVFYKYFVPTGLTKAEAKGHKRLVPVSYVT
jgi:hypothetical protein